MPAPAIHNPLQFAGHNGVTPRVITKSGYWNLRCVEGADDMGIDEKADERTGSNWIMLEERIKEEGIANFTSQS